MANATLMLLLFVPATANIATAQEALEADWFQSNTPTGFIESLLVPDPKDASKLVTKDAKDVSRLVVQIFRTVDGDDDKILLAEEITGSGISAEWQQWIRDADDNGDGKVNFSPEFISRVGDLVQRRVDPVSYPLSPGWLITYAVVALIILSVILFAYTTQAGVIARATTKEAIRQPVFLMLVGVGVLFMVLNTYLPFFTLGEDVKMLIDCGLATILIIGALMAVWTASTSISSEIEGKTAMTLLSKPINRRQFILGKYIGILQAVFWMLLIPIGCFLLLILYKVGYDAREGAKEIPPLVDRLPIMLQTLPGLALIVLEISVLAAVSVAISTRLPMVVNIVATFAIFVVGHLTPVLVQTGVLQNEFVQFMARLIATVLPSLEVFNMEAAVATGAIVPYDYLGFALLYCLAYCAAAILLAFLLFEDRDLA